MIIRDSFGSGFCDTIKLESLQVNRFGITGVSA